eukprot:349352_1
MIYAKGGHSAIELNSIIYVFGGNPTAGNDHYQYTNLIPTLSPTISPTLVPSSSPSTVPTSNPSNPTANYTFSPLSPTIPHSSQSSAPSRNKWIGVAICTGIGFGLLLCVIFCLVYA